jgi:ubiquitin carboxyl-terminal hydrolase L3
MQTSNHQENKSQASTDEGNKVSLAEEKTKHMVKSKCWLPLESNPDLMTSYIHKLGVDENFVFHEVYGLDPDLLMMVPEPCFAVLLLFPITDASEKHRIEQQQEIEEKGQAAKSDDVYWMKQIIGNACGTIGLLHAICNVIDLLKLDEGKFFHKFHQATINMSPTDRALALEANEDIEVEHESLASSAQSEVSHSINDNLHFVAFVPKNGYLWELDGRACGPICHGKTTDVLMDVAIIVKQFMDRAPGDVRFNMVSLGCKQF